ncbi:MAG TPA: hypothetical protein VHO91_21250 [Rhodopila sp.]|nr:hypothetical protein [Rhodopila sp.]
MIFPTTVRSSFRLPGLSRSGLRGVPPNLQGRAAEALAKLIGDRRQHVIAEGVRPVPGTICRAMQGYFPDALLRKCRFSVGEAGPLKLPAFRLSYGSAVLVALGDVVIFGSDHAAHTDLKLWAQALTHVMQYQRWGLDEYASRFVRDRGAIEKEAAANALRFLAWSRDRAALARA